MGEDKKTKVAYAHSGRGFITLSLCVLMIIFLIASPLLSSCTKIKDTDEVLTKHAKALIEKSVILNRIYWGKGIPKKEGGSVMVDERFTEANMSSLAEYGITDMESLKEYTRLVYSENECENLIKNYLERSSYTDSFNDVQYTEVYTRYLADSHGTLFVRDELDDLIGDSITEYKYDTIRIGERTKRTVTLTIDVYLTTPDANKQGYTDTLTLEMRLENGEYRLNTPTYCIYDSESAKVG